MTTPTETPPTVTIFLSDYHRLLRAEARLEALDAGGVDNWDFHWDSLNDHYIDPITGENWQQVCANPDIEL